MKKLLSLINNALKQYETSIVYSNIARCHLKLEEINKCIDNCAMALTHNPNNFKAELMLGDSSLLLAEKEQNELFADQAQEYYKKAIAI